MLHDMYYIVCMFYDTILYKTEEGKKMFGDFFDEEEFYVQEKESESEKNQEKEDLKVDEDLPTSEGVKKLK